VDDLSSFKETLEMLIKDKKMREEIGKKGRSLVLERYNMSFIAECFKKEIDDILSS